MYNKNINCKKEFDKIKSVYIKGIMKIADKIVVLNKGRVVGQGSHKELMKNNEYYIDLQTNKYSSLHKKGKFSCYE